MGQKAIFVKKKRGVDCIFATGTQQRLIRRDSAQTLLYVSFDTKGNPFVNLCIDKWYLFYLFYKPSLEVCIPFDFCK